MLDITLDISSPVPDMRHMPPPVDTLGGSHQWDSIVDLADSKNDTTIVWSLIQAAGLESALDESNFTATVFLPTDEYLSAAADSIDTDDVVLMPGEMPLGAQPPSTA
ncbi:expressed protein [Chlorella variabilis]|uniref:Expressed protein n=1 Tax=Chlorella variabilis TaxID=554065 RepID=E1ZM76_CHLVA|nr:expressed protein [Chlorella variabilis]EFN53060.1 expressed protein [Chlorella variabilis]|eukprot:XP_005845162.1 expressed protein [Chlorella variabilis]